MVRQLRFGRGIDNRQFTATSFTYRAASREAVMKLGEHMRLHPVLRGVKEPYRYEREVEEFLRWSPHVRNAAYRAEGRLGAGELIELQRLLSSYSDRVGATGATPMEQAEAATRAASTPPPEAEPNGDAPERVISAADEAEGSEPPAAAPQEPSHEPAGHCARAREQAGP